MIIIFLSNYQRDTEKNIQGVKSNYVLMTKNKFVNIYSEDCKLCNAHNANEDYNVCA